MNININKQVKIVLTDSGKEVYRNYLKQFEANCSISQSIPDEMKLPLWEFAQIFGSVMYNGNPNAPFTINNEIELVS